ncbi:response regulator [Pseudomaricurvus sp. HS19]|uniref:response regulator n=1 Tax=Pseudomaricurvus sp. HS19 TaxID=2692626 RepID=UPI001367ADB0|nr:response regulator [Pseudomaricurvus sp. HS19]MYM64952.1 response regulator [Pseudomaricurvus sp. HS19]
MHSNPLSVVVVDDHPLFRRGVVELLNDSDEMRVVAEYDNAFALLDNLEDVYPDILLLDLQMPEKSGLELLKQIRECDDQLKIIIITACTDQDKLLEALRFGANGYLQKDTPPDDILDHLLAVAEGKVALNVDAITSLATHIRENHTQQASHHHAALDDMTERERETLSLIARGLNNKLIARELGISDGTVKVYVKNLLRKLNMHSRLELAAWAHKNLSEELLS